MRLNYCREAVVAWVGLIVVAASSAHAEQYRAWGGYSRGTGVEVITVAVDDDEGNVRREVGFVRSDEVMPHMPAAYPSGTSWQEPARAAFDRVIRESRVKIYASREEALAAPAVKAPAPPAGSGRYRVGTWIATMDRREAVEGLDAFEVIQNSDGRVLGWLNEAHVRQARAMPKGMPISMAVVDSIIDGREAIFFDDERTATDLSFHQRMDSPGSRARPPKHRYEMPLTVIPSFSGAAYALVYDAFEGRVLGIARSDDMLGRLGLSEVQNLRGLIDNHGAEFAAMIDSRAIPLYPTLGDAQARRRALPTHSQKSDFGNGMRVEAQHFGPKAAAPIAPSAKGGSVVCEDLLAGDEALTPDLAGAAGDQSVPQELF